MGAILLVLMVGLVIILPFWSKIFYSSDTIEVRSPQRLRRDAKIIDVSRRKVGLKGDYKFETCVTFDDGFKYSSYDTERENHFGYYTISVTEDATKAIIVRAEQAHASECGAAVIAKPFVCGKCGHQGPYEGNCPECGSSLKRYTN